MFRNKYALVFFVTLIAVTLVLSAGFFIKKNNISISLNINSPAQSGKISPAVSQPGASVPSVTAAAQYFLEMVDLPGEKTAGEVATFTWNVNGPPSTIKTTTVYYGPESTPGNFSHDILPLNTKYSGYLREFINGNYRIPLRFVGNSTILEKGKLYARAYALIDGKNYWSDEHSFSVKSPLHTINIVSFPDRVKLNDNAAFTWEISGPVSKSQYSAIVGAKQTVARTPDETTALSQTPYRELVSEFTKGNFDLPLTFVGNTTMPEYGTWYIRALAIIDGKYYWSSEHSLAVE